MTKFLLLITSSFLLCLSVQSQKLNLKKGQKFTYKFDEAWSVGGNKSTKQTIVDYVVTDKIDTNYILSGVVRKVVHEENSTYGKYRINTEDINDCINTGGSDLFIGEIALINQPFTATLSENFHSDTLKGVSKAILTKAEEWSIKDEFIPQILHSGQGFLNIIYGLGFFKLPNGRPLQAGMEWTDSSAKSQYKITSKGKDNFLIEIKRSINFEGENDYTETDVIDGKTALVLNKQFEYKYQNFIDGKLITDVRTTQVSYHDNVFNNSFNSDFFDMVAKTSFFSNALKTNGQVDSLKVMSYINQYEPEFGKVKSFVTNKLGLLQSIADLENFKASQYVKTLMKTPSYLMQGTHHLSNKRNYVTNADSVATIFSLMDKSQLYSSLQDGFAQAFLDDDSARFQFAFDAIDKGLKYELLKESLLPVYYWASAIKEKGNLQRSLLYANQLQALPEPYWKQGNAGRYALLLYKELNKPGVLNESKNILNKTITTLTEFYNNGDSLSKQHFLLKSILSHAWYFKSQQSEAEGNKEEMLSDLSKAAYYSPKNQNEKIYESWYDNVFLNGKENYTNDYLIALSANGQKDIAIVKFLKEDYTSKDAKVLANLTNKDDALQKFMKAFVSLPESYFDFKKFYISNYGERSFGDFFNKNVLPKLKDAPGFDLKNLKGESKNLKSLSGKWNVVDFWGTWCGPCVGEMPELNRFYNSLIEQKNSKISFISIACRDKEDRVKNFLAKNNYTIPVLMSDNDIENRYGIMGYPTKVIISPAGKMILLPFGYDWQTLIKDLSSL